MSDTHTPVARPIPTLTLDWSQVDNDILDRIEALILSVHNNLLLEATPHSIAHTKATLAAIETIRAEINGE